MNIRKISKSDFKELFLNLKSVSVATVAGLTVLSGTAMGEQDASQPDICDIDSPEMDGLENGNDLEDQLKENQEKLEALSGSESGNVDYSMMGC